MQALEWGEFDNHVAENLVVGLTRMRCRVSEGAIRSSSNGHGMTALPVYRDSIAAIVAFLIRYKLAYALLWISGTTYRAGTTGGAGALARRRRLVLDKEPRPATGGAFCNSIRLIKHFSICLRQLYGQ